ncbi:MAG: hypothetical protein KAR17_07775, partial [Cyclobacteriaceae bacterium]|nr:hypothetical protein [Cyclobacteriaceae bacterium]
MKSLFAILIFLPLTITAQEIDTRVTMIDGEYQLPNTVAPLDYADDLIYKTNASEYCPVNDEVFVEHVRKNLSQNEEQKINDIFSSKSKKLKESKYSNLLNTPITSIQKRNQEVWIGTESGLYIFNTDSQELTKHESYGVNGPLSTHISDMIMDSKGTLWIGTPIGLNSLSKDGVWSSIRGSDGLPVEEITALAIDREDRIWIGTTQGAIFYTP